MGAMTVARGVVQPLQVQFSPLECALTVLVTAIRVTADLGVVERRPVVTVHCADHPANPGHPGQWLCMRKLREAQIKKRSRRPHDLIRSSDA
jgi:hypothetical protein